MSVDEAIKELQELSSQGKGGLKLISDSENAITGFKERDGWKPGTKLIEVEESR